MTNNCHVEIKMGKKFGSICGDGALAVDFLQSEILPALAIGAHITFDFEGVQVMNSSFSNALFGNLMKTSGKAVISRLKVTNARPIIKSEVRSSTCLGVHHKKSA